MTYTDGKVKTTITGAVGMSHYAMLLITKSYVRDFKGGDRILTNEVAVLKKYKTPTALLFFDDVDVEDMKKLLVGLNVVKEFEKVPYETFSHWLRETFNPWLDEMREKQ